MMPFNRLGPVFKRFASLIYPQQFQNELQSLSETVAGGANILDLGAGTGVLSQFIFHRRKDLTFILLDPAPGMLKYSPGFAVRIAAAAESLPFPDNFFSIIMIGDAMHHFKSFDRAFAQIQRVLAPTGMLIIFEIDPEKTIGRLIAWGERLFGEPAHFMVPEDLSERLTLNGFICTRYDYGWRYAITGKKPGLDSGS